MDNKEFTTVVDNTIQSTASLLIVKGEEYAGSEDRLANFKRGAQLTGTTPLQTALVYASKHYDSICTFIRKDAAGQKQVLSEPIEGRFDDLINYCILMKALVIEQCNKKQPLPNGTIVPTTLGELTNEKVISSQHAHLLRQTNNT